MGFETVFFVGALYKLDTRTYNNYERTDLELKLPVAV